MVLSPQISVCATAAPPSAARLSCVGREAHVLANTWFYFNMRIKSTRLSLKYESTAHRIGSTVKLVNVGSLLCALAAHVSTPPLFAPHVVILLSSSCLQDFFCALFFFFFLKTIKILFHQNFDRTRQTQIILSGWPTSLPALRALSRIKLQPLFLVVGYLQRMSTLKTVLLANHSLPH